MFFREDHFCCEVGRPSQSICSYIKLRRAGLNPEFILGLTATPKDGMNNLCKVTGLELKDEEMVKLDLHIIPPVGNIENDWKGMLQNLVTKRNQLEQKAIEYKQETGQYIRPIALIQCERTGIQPVNSD